MSACDTSVWQFAEEPDHLVDVCAFGKRVGDVDVGAEPGGEGEHGLDATDVRTREDPAGDFGTKDLRDPLCLAAPSFAQ